MNKIFEQYFPVENSDNIVVVVIFLWICTYLKDVFSKKEKKDRELGGILRRKKETIL